MICHNGQRGSLKNLVDAEASASDSEAAGSWESRATTESGISEAQRTLRIAKSADGPKLQGHFAENRSCSHIPRVENVGDLTTADHNVPNEECESRNRHRYAVIAQDSATHWLQSVPMQNKDFTANGKESAVFSSRKPFQMCVYTVYSREYGKACGDLYTGNIVLQRLIVPRRMGTAERSRYAGVKEATPAVLL